MRRRLRSAIKWSCTGLTLLLLVVWIGSAWWRCSLRCSSTGPAFFFEGGQLIVIWRAEPGVWNGRVRSPAFRRNFAQFGWWFGWRQTLSYGGNSASILTIPLWILVLLTATPSAMFWYRLRPRQGRCPSCNYDLRATTTGICPECGSDRIDRSLQSRPISESIT